MSFFDPENFTWPFGTHIAVVEIDEMTGETSLVTDTLRSTTLAT